MKVYQKDFKNALKVAKHEGKQTLVFTYSYQNKIVGYSFMLRSSINPLTKIILVTHSENGLIGHIHDFKDFKKAAEHCNLLLSDFYAVAKTKGVIIHT